MARANHDSDSDVSNSESTARESKYQAESPEGQSDHPDPAESEEEDNGVYEIEKILDAKRGATGSVRFLKHFFGRCASNYSLERQGLATSLNGKDMMTTRIAGLMNEMPCK